MSKPARQLTFDLALEPSFAPDDFLVSGSNAEAHAMICRWPDWPDRTLLLTGSAGSGKSHLGAIWGATAGARVVAIGDRLDPAQWSTPAIGLLDDCDRADHPDDALFHLCNVVRESGGWLLLTSRTSPAHWNIRTADLLSRLRLAPMIAIGRPDDELLRAVTVKLFADRQIRIDADVVAYAARHCEQSLDGVARFVAAVDEQSLAEGRRITRPLAARILAKECSSSGE